jgi:transcriptional regulator with GAF, ATPase, and Fis domain
MHTEDFKKDADSFMGQMKKSYDVEVYGYNAKNLSPIDYPTIFDFVSKVIGKILKSDQATKLAVNVTSGTPAMSAIMLYLGKNRNMDVYATRDAKFTPPNEERVLPVNWSFVDALHSFSPTDIEEPKFYLSDEVMEDLNKLAPLSDVNILIGGETGVGKSLLAKKIHQMSLSKGPFVEFNCAELSGDQTMAVSRLFGHKKGAFTGAISDHQGVFQQANNGTLFLDEIGELEPAIQSVLLMAIQKRAINILGDDTPIDVKVKLITATNKNILDMVRGGLFRSDLYYRLAEYELELPSVRELPEKSRRELIARLLESISKKFKLEKSISNESLAKMADFNWPGNIRQIDFLLKRVYLLSDGARLNNKKITNALENMKNRTIEGSACAPSGSPWDNEPLREAVDLYRKYRVKLALDKHGGNKSLAARSLGISPQTLNDYLYKEVNTSGGEAP